MSKENNASAIMVPEEIYYSLIQATVSYSLGRRWYPTNLQRGWIEDCWRKAIKPEVAVQEILQKLKERKEK